MTPASSTPAVSVLIASYGAQAFIERAIRSVLAQTVADLEVIVVDDVSPDDSAGLVEALAREDARVRLVRMAANGGPAAARNRAIAEARGRWLAVVDSDDLLAPDRFETLIAAAEATGADMIADDLLVFDDGAADGAKPFLNARDRRVGAFDLSLGEYLRRSVMYGADPNPGFLKPMIKRVSLDALGIRYDERLRIGEDDDLVIRSLLGGLCYRVVARPGYFYRKHGTSISHRLGTGALDAMIAADAALHRRITAERPDLSRACRIRSTALRRARAFDHLVSAMKERRFGTALFIAIRAPGALPLLRMPLLGRMRRLRPSPRVPTRSPDGDELRLLLNRRQALTPS